MHDVAHARVRFFSGGEPVSGYLAHPQDSREHDGVLIAPDAFGLDRSIHELAQRLATAGLVALALDGSTRRGPPPRIDSAADLAAAEERMSDTEALLDLEAARAFLRQDRRVRGGIALLGIGAGGSQALLAAADAGAADPAARPYAAAVVLDGPLRHARLSKHRPRHPLDGKATIRTPLLLLYQEGSTAVSLADVEQLRGQLTRNEVPHEVLAVPGIAPDAPPAERRARLLDAGVPRILSFLREHLASR